MKDTVRVCVCVCTTTACSALRLRRRSPPADWLIGEAVAASVAAAAVQAQQANFASRRDQQALARSFSLFSASTSTSLAAAKECVWRREADANDNDAVLLRVAETRQQKPRRQQPLPSVCCFSYSTSRAPLQTQTQSGEARAPSARLEAAAAAAAYQRATQLAAGAAAAATAARPRRAEKGSFTSCAHLPLIVSSWEVVFLAKNVRSGVISWRMHTVSKQPSRCRRPEPKECAVRAD